MDPQRVDGTGDDSHRLGVAAVTPDRVEIAPPIHDHAVPPI